MVLLLCALLCCCCYSCLWLLAPVVDHRTPATRHVSSFRQAATIFITNERTYSLVHPLEVQPHLNGLGLSTSLDRYGHARSRRRASVRRGETPLVPLYQRPQRDVSALLNKYPLSPSIFLVLVERRLLSAS